MMPAESAHDTVAALGHVGLLQFKDLNTEKSAFQRSYATQVIRFTCLWLGHSGLVAHTECDHLGMQVKRCDEMARKLRFFHDQVRSCCCCLKFT